MDLYGKKLLPSLFLVLAPAAVVACPTCEQRPEVWAGIFNENFPSLLIQVGSAVPILIVIGLSFRLVDRYPALFPGVRPAPIGAPPHGPLIAAGVTLGTGLGGFLDGIFLHMLMQWHNLIAQRVPAVDFVSLEINMFWDGIFSLGMWTINVVGITLLWRAVVPKEAWRSGWAVVAAMLVGWGIFHVIDSLMFHWILNLHHIRQGVEDWLFWDLAYLGMGVALILTGWAGLAWTTRPRGR